MKSSSAGGIRLFLILITAFLMPSGYARADGAGLKASVPHVTVVGNAHAEIVPNLATIFLGVEDEEPTADAALGKTTQAAKAVMDDLRAQGVEEKDIRTTSLDLSKVYDDQRDSSGRVGKRIFRSYRAQNMFSVHVRDVGKAGALARRAFDHGANTFNGIIYDSDAVKQKQLELQGEAAKDARANAESYAGALGLTLGRAIEIAAPNYSGPGVMAAAPMRKVSFAAAQAADVDIPLAPGTLTLQASISVTWELKAP